MIDDYGLNMVEVFHEVYKQPINDEPHVEDYELNALRVHLIFEELRELHDALESKDTVATFDALLDLQYVLDGAFLSLGFHKFKRDGMHEVHASNLSKLDMHGKPIYREDGKVLKGPNFREPDLVSILYD